MKIFRFLFSGVFMGILITIFTVAIGYATFIENDYDATTARLLIYNARWFEVLLFLMIVNFFGMIFTKKLYKKSKLNVLVIHLALVIIIIGAALTRYLGFEGVMHIRNGQTSNTFLTADTYVSIDFEKSDLTKSVKDKVLISPHVDGLYSQVFELGDQNLAVELSNYYEFAQKKLVEDPNGAPYLHVIVGAKDGRHDILLKEGESELVHGFGVSFGKTDLKNHVQIIRQNDSLFVKMPLEINEDQSGGVVTISEGSFNPVRILDLLSFQKTQFMIKEFKPSGSIAYEPVEDGSGHASTGVLAFNINGEQHFTPLNEEKEVMVDDVKLTLYVGEQEMELPFALQLKQFTVERYPGSNSPSSFKSDIVLIDEQSGLNKPYAIYMNNILEYKGYRFYQSSYDRDEKGAVLSVNHDYWGTRVTYLGYFLLFGTMILSFFMKHNRFINTLALLKEISAKRIQTSTSVAVVLMALCFSAGQANAQSIDKTHAREFGELIVQGPGGRMMPVNTLASQILIKVHKKSTYLGMNADQVLLSMMVSPTQWMSRPFVRVNHEEVQQLLGVDGQLASYSDFFDARGQFKLSGEVRSAYNKKPALKNQYDKELIKVSERINILHNLLTGTMLNLLPLPDDPNNTWTSSSAYSQIAMEDNQLEGEIFEEYLHAVREAIATGDYSAANQQLAEVRSYQRIVGVAVAPSTQRMKLEILYNDVNIFKRLFPVYLTIGMLLVTLFFVQILKPSFTFKKATKVFFGIIIIAFALQTLGLVLRWYISGHAPWSNGYESMIYISWATVLAGFLFMKKSPITLGLTATLAGITLLTAHMSWMDPEITNLVPVLKSYWLTIHVAAITASYGFIGLAALLGFFNLCLMPFRKTANQVRLNLMIKELSLIIELSLMGGLTLLVIGNFLGAIWANESWGRYWGWDPKETWTLVTIMFYSFVLHMNLIPRLKSTFMFNFLSLIGLSTVLMTYFGVNFYLSGLHSYAGGDPVPVPVFVYYTLGVIGLVSGLALYNQITVGNRQVAAAQETKSVAS